MNYIKIIFYFVLFTQINTIVLIQCRNCNNNLFLIMFLQLNMGGSLAAFKDSQKQEKMEKIRTQHDVGAGFFG